MKTGDIILFKTTSPSFSWCNGLKIVLNINKKSNELSTCDLDKEGKPSLFDDGRFMVSITGYNNNPNVYSTNLKYKLPKGYKYS